MPNLAVPGTILKLGRDGSYKLVVDTSMDEAHPHVVSRYVGHYTLDGLRLTLIFKNQRLQGTFKGSELLVEDMKPFTGFDLGCDGSFAKIK